MALYPPHEKEQLGAIKSSLEKAPKIQKQLKEKFGYGENIFFDLDLIEYRIKNSLNYIAEKLDVKSLYDVSSDKVAEESVGSAFRGYDNEEFLPEYQFEGLFGEQLNDLIEESRRRIAGQKNYELGVGVHGRTAEERSEYSRKAGRKSYELGVGIHGRTAEEMSEHGRKGYAKGLGKITAEERSEYSRKAGRKAGQKNYELGVGIHGRTAEEMSEHGRKAARKSAEARGAHIWSLDELVSLHEIREESVGKGYKKFQPCMTYVTEKFNERHGTELTKVALTKVYSSNKHRLSEADVDVAEPFWSLDKLVSLHEIREKSIGKGYLKSKPCWTYVTKEFNEQHGTELSKKVLNGVYSNNKHRLSEEE